MSWLNAIGSGLRNRSVVAWSIILICIVAITLVTLNLINPPSQSTITNEISTQTIPTVIALEGTDTPYSDIPISTDNIEQVSVLTRWGKGILTEVKISSNGKLLAAATSSGVRLYDAKSFQMAQYINTDSWVDVIEFSPDSQLLATSNIYDNKVYLWNIANGELINIFDKHTDFVEDIAFSPDGQILASSSRDNSIIMWSLIDGTNLQTLKTDTQLYTISFSSDGEKITSGGEGGSIYLWNVSDGKLIYTLSGHTDFITDLKFSIDNKLLISTSSNQELKTWNIASGSLIANLQGGKFTLSPDGKYISSIKCQDDMQCKTLLWESGSGELIKTYDVNAPLYSVTFSLDSQLIAAGSMEEIFILSVSDNSILNTIRPQNIASGFYEPVNTLFFLPDSQFLISKSGETNIKQWQIDGALLSQEDFGQSDAGVTAISKSGRLFAIAANDTIQIRDVANGEIIRTLKGHEYFVNNLMFSPDDETLLATRHGNKANIWNIQNGVLLQTIEIEFGETFKSISPDMTILASTNGTDINLWNVSNGTLANTLLGQPSRIKHIKFSMDRKTLAAILEDGSVIFWDVQNGTKINSIIIDGQVSFWDTVDLAFSPDGQKVVIFGVGIAPQVWNIADGTYIGKFADNRYADSVTFSPDGQLLLAFDGETVRVYMSSDLNLLRKIKIQTYFKSVGYPSINFFPDGKTVSITSGSGIVWLLGVSTENPLPPLYANLPTLALSPNARTESAEIIEPSPAPTFSITPNATDPVLPNVTQVTCSNFTSQLQPNIMAIVTTDAINLREKPGTNQVVIEIIYINDKVQITGEPPICGDGYLWWKVQVVRSGAVGWVVEGIEGERWLSP